MVDLRTAWRLGGLTKGFTWQGNSWLSMPGDIDVAKIGDGSNNSAVEACLRVLAKSVAEPKIGLDTDDGIEHDHPAARLLRRPAPWLRGSLLTRHIVSAVSVHSHAVLWKQRSAVGRVVRLVPLPPTMVEPADGDSVLATTEEQIAHRNGQGETITHFVYEPDMGRQVRLEVSDVVYIREDIDPSDPKRGRSGLRTLLREVLQDEEASLFAAALLTNLGVPGYVLVPDLAPGEAGPSKPEADAIADNWHKKLTGAKRGRPIMMSGKVTPHKLSFSPEEMNFEAVRRIPEERISGVLGVPGILAGLGAGLEHATYSNARELREFFTEETCIAWWEMLAEEYTWQLLPDFVTRVVDPLAYDLTTVRALQQDEKDLWERYGRAVETGTITVAEFREAVGLDELPNTDVFLRPLNLVEMPTTTPVPDPEPSFAE